MYFCQASTGAIWSKGHLWACAIANKRTQVLMIPTTYLPMYIVNTRKFAHRKSIQVIISLSQDLWHFQSVCWGVQATTTTMAHNALKPGKKCYTINITPHFKVFALQFFISCYFYILSLMNTLVHCAVSCNMKKYLPSLE